MAATKRQTFKPGDRAYVHDYGKVWRAVFVTGVEEEMTLARRWTPEGFYRLTSVPTGKQTVRYGVVSSYYPRAMARGMGSTVFGAMHFETKTVQNNRARIRNALEYEPLRLQAVEREEQRERERQARELRREANARGVAERIVTVIGEYAALEWRAKATTEIARILLDEAGDYTRRISFFGRAGPRIVVTDNDKREDES
jgi:hypothetical protein